MRTSPRLGLNNGVLIDQLGFGLYKVPAAETADLVAAALDAGYRHFDTAAMYGNETGVARGLSPLLGGPAGSGGSGELSSSLARGDLFITTKLWNDHHGYDAALRAFDDSMVNLGLDYVDLYLIHWPCPAQGPVPGDLPRPGNPLPGRQGPRDRRQQLPARPPGPAPGNRRGGPRRQPGRTAPLAAAGGAPRQTRRPWASGPRRGVRWAAARSSRIPASPALRLPTTRTPAQVILRWHMQLGNIAIPKAVLRTAPPRKPGCFRL